MSTLGLFDQILLKLEQSGMAPMVMGGAMILDPVGSPYPLDGPALAGHLAARMERIPIMRKKIVQDALKLGDVRLVDDPDFDVRNHISLVRLESPGGYRELTDCLGTLSAQRLDLERPLWHYEVIEGLEGGRLAVATHIHHCILDGIGAMEALSGLWNQHPVPADEPTASRWQVAATPTSFDLIKDALGQTARKLYVNAPRFLWKTARPLVGSQLRKLPAQLARKGAVEPEPGITVPEVRRTSINTGRISPKRVISYVELPLAEVKALSKRFECSINDLCILFTGSALEHYFAGIGETIDFDLVVGMPINVRASGDKSAGNVLTAARLGMHNTIGNIEQRLAAIAADTRSIKSRTKPDRGARPKVDIATVGGLFSPILLDALFLSVVKLNVLDRLALVNVGVTNVPGSPVPMYMAGARQVGMVPMAPVVDTVGLTVCVSSSDTSLAIGFHGCGRAIKNKELLVEGTLKAMRALQRAAGTATATPQPAASAQRGAAAAPKRTAAPAPKLKPAPRAKVTAPKRKPAKRASSSAPKRKPTRRATASAPKRKPAPRTARRRSS